MRESPESEAMGAPGDGLSEAEADKQSGSGGTSGCGRWLGMASRSSGRSMPRSGTGREKEASAWDLEKACLSLQRRMG